MSPGDEGVTVQKHSELQRLVSHTVIADLQ